MYDLNPVVLARLVASGGKPGLAWLRMTTPALLRARATSKAARSQAMLAVLRGPNSEEPPLLSDPTVWMVTKVMGPSCHRAFSGNWDDCRSTVLDGVPRV